MSPSEVVVFIDEYEDESDQDVVAALIHAQNITHNITDNYIQDFLCVKIVVVCLLF